MLLYIVLHVSASDSNKYYYHYYYYYPPIALHKTLWKVCILNYNLFVQLMKLDKFETIMVSYVNTYWTNQILLCFQHCPECKLDYPRHHGSLEHLIGDRIQQILQNQKTTNLQKHDTHVRQMGHYVMVSLWCESLSNNTRFCFLYFRMNNC